MYDETERPGQQGLRPATLFRTFSQRVSQIPTAAFQTKGPKNPAKLQINDHDRSTSMRQ